MKRSLQLAAIVAATALCGGPAAAQEPIGVSMPEQQYRAGWTFTPAFGFGASYDDNISLFGEGSGHGVNQDYIASYVPEADLRYTGQHTAFGADYAGSFLQYRTFSALNRWDQRGRLELHRQETARLKWFADATAAAMPSTDLIDLGGIPYRHVGAQTFNGRGGVDYELGAHNSITATYMAQKISFDRPEDLSNVLRGGQVQQVMTAYRHKVDERLSFGGDYTYRRSVITGDVAPFDIHEVLGAVDYELGPVWSLSGGGGVVYLLPTPFTPARTGPAYRIGLSAHRGGTAFRVAYMQSYIPSFGFGGTVQNRELGASLRLPLFGSRHLYVEETGTFRDDQPLTAIDQQLPLRSFRSFSIFGWTPQPWLRVEAYYARVQQSSLRAGGQLYRDRVGFQIVTSHSMRIQ